MATTSSALFVFHLHSLTHTLPLRAPVKRNSSHIPKSVTSESLKVTAAPWLMSSVCLWRWEEEGGEDRGQERDWYRTRESGGPGERGEEEWVVARDLSCSKLNLSSSLLLQPRPLCPWALSADSAGFVFVPLQKVPRLQPYYKSLLKDLMFTRNFCI